MLNCIDDDSSLTIAKELILKGKIIAYPTDTLYGLGVDATNSKAVNILNKLKERKQPYSIIVNSINMLKKYAYISSNDEKKVKKFLPGPYTLILKKKHTDLSKLVTLDLNTVGIRIPRHNFCINLINIINKPIVTTSINKHGNKPLNSIADIQNNFPEINLFKDDEINTHSKGSTIIDFAIKPGKILRQGDGEI